MKKKCKTNHTLSKRKYEITRLITLGFKYSMIAARLKINVKTVSNIIHNKANGCITEVLGTKNLAEMTHRSIEKGFVGLGECFGNSTTLVEPNEMTLNEFVIVLGIAMGLYRKEIATLLGLSQEDTVTKYISGDPDVGNFLKKSLGFYDTVRITHYAILKGLVALGDCFEPRTIKIRKIHYLVSEREKQLALNN